MENYSIAYNPFVTGQRFRLRLCVGCANRSQSILISAGYIFGCFLTSDEWRMDEIVVKIVGVKHSSRHIPHSKIHNLNCNVLLIQFLYRFKCKIFQWILLMLSVVNCFHKNKKLSMRSGRAGPPFSVRPEKEAKGAAATVATVACARHIGSRKRWCTLEPVRRTFPNSTPHGVSNTWKGSFLPSGQKSSHEPRRQMLQMLPWPSASVLRCI